MRTVTPECKKLLAEGSSLILRDGPQANSVKEFLEAHKGEPEFEELFLLSIQLRQMYLNQIPKDDGEAEPEDPADWWKHSENDE